MSSIFEKIAIYVAVVLIVFLCRPLQAKDIRQDYGAISECMAGVSYAASVPRNILEGIRYFELGAVGETFKEDGGVYYGFMKVNSDLVRPLSKEWKKARKEVKRLLIQDPCSNIGVAAQYLSRALNPSKNTHSVLTEYYSSMKNLDEKTSQKYADITIKIMEELKIPVGINAMRKTVSTIHWQLLVYSGVTMVKNPKKTQSLESCFAEGYKMYMGNTQLRYQCLEPKSGKLYGAVSKSLIRPEWSKEFPRSLQMGRKALWLD